MIIRIINDTDFKKVADMIARSVSNSAFTKFYPKQSIEYIKESLNEEGVKKRASWTHFYVIEEDDKIVNLSTCTVDDKFRFVVSAVLVEK